MGVRMNEIERVKEKIAQLLALDQGWHWENATKFPHITKHYLGLAGKVLATEGVLVKSDNQTPPKLKSLAGEASIAEKSAYVLGIADTIEHMLKPDSEGRVWVRCLKKEVM